MAGNDFGEYWRHCRRRTESVLESAFERQLGVPSRLLKAMRYATLNGGKRFRALLVYAAAERSKHGISAPAGPIDKAAAAIELVHAYSLVHDDLPAMDNDDLRRGRPACHRRFDEATAILVGDALQSLAFELLADSDPGEITNERKLLMVQCLAEAIGGNGMAGGQQLDMDATNCPLDLEDLVQMHAMKTGALISASCRMGGLAMKQSEASHLEALGRYGQAVGMTFQIVDDILDVTADSATLGKRSGSDRRMKKNTFVSLLGLKGARLQRDRWHEIAMESAGELGDNGGMIFRQIADFVVARSY